jgi:hypothetical protein
MSSLTREPEAEINPERETFPGAWLPAEQPLRFRLPILAGNQMQSARKKSPQP